MVIFFPVALFTTVLIAFIAVSVVLILNDIILAFTNYVGGL